MKQTSEFMKEIAEIVKEGGNFGGLTWYDDTDDNSDMSISEGNDAPGFVNFTDGFVYRQQPYYPLRDEHLTFKGFDKRSKHNAENVQKVLDNLEDTDSLVGDFFDDNLGNDEYADLAGRFGSKDDFVCWYNGYIAHEYNYEQLSLFTGKPDPVIVSDKRLDELYDEITDFCDEYYSESPAFIGVAVRLYDNDNRRNDRTDGKKICVVESYFNDDLSYGRESVGDWAGKNIIGNRFGKQIIYTDEFAWDTEKDLKTGLRKRIGNAYASLGF